MLLQKRALWEHLNIQLLRLEGEQNNIFKENKGMANIGLKGGLVKAYILFILYKPGCMIGGL